MTRTWCNESTTFYEFMFLGHEAMTGSIIVTTQRAEQTRLQVKVTIEIEGRLSYTETTELAEHSRTGLYGVTNRTKEGRHTPAQLDTLTPSHAEIFEYAPESALSTVCGTWIAELLRWVYLTAGQDGAVEVPALEGQMPAEALRAEPRAVRNDPPRSNAAAQAPRSNAAGATQRPVLVPEPAPPPPVPVPVPEPAPASRRAAPSLLVASTSNGDRWEVEAPETYMGRSKQCSIVLKSQRVSRKHASITREDDGFYINDLGAANGIWAGTDKVEREKIEDGSEYIIGDVLVSFSYA